MARLSILLCGAHSLVAVALQPSKGCTAARKGTQNQVDVGWRHVSVEDFELIDRSFWLVAPPAVSAAPEVPAALLLSFHGQYGDASEYANAHDFARFVPGGERLVVAYPQGMDDGGLGSGWNVGSASDASVCLSTGVQFECYESCNRLKLCGRCNWSTCFDDRRFIRTLLASITDDLCIDLDRVYAQGESNGAMAAHYLVQEMPGTFAAFVAFYGNPMLGYSGGASAQMLRDIGLVRQTAVLQFHGRQDTLIPLAGGVSDEGWIYEPLEKIQGAWAGLHGCASSPARAAVPSGSGQRRLACAEYHGCTSGRRVMRCLYDGAHGDWPDGTAGEEMTMWFVLQFRRNSTGPPDFSGSFRSIADFPRPGPGSQRMPPQQLAFPPVAVALLVGAAVALGAAGAAAVRVARLFRPGAGVPISARECESLRGGMPAVRPQQIGPSSDGGL